MQLSETPLPVITPLPRVPFRIFPSRLLRPSPRRRGETLLALLVSPLMALVARPSVADVAVLDVGFVAFTCLPPVVLTRS